MQVVGNASRDNHLTEEELDPQALVYKKLWLEAQAELCSLKYETRVLCMQLEMGGRKVDRNKVKLLPYYPWIFSFFNLFLLISYFV